MMTSLELARWQFGITTVYHFIFVPLTIGLAFFTAWCQTRWYRSGEEHWLRATRFWGKLMLISFAMGVATGLVQEFQFGMNWSNYSRFVGDIFGAPLAMEGLAAFFVESTFLGLWLFGWGRLSKRLHLMSIWLVSLSTMASAYFILAANSWMQHPVGYKMNEATGKAELTNIWAVLFNNTAIYALVHTLLACLITGAMVIAAISAWHLLRKNELAVFRGSMRMALPVLAIASVATIAVGHFNGVLMANQQPMKMAAADAVFDTKDGAGLSLFAIGDMKSNPEGLKRNVEVPNLLSFIMTGKPMGKVEGVNDINLEYQQKYGKGEYAPIVAVAYWSWRTMIGSGMLLALLGIVGWWLVRKDRLETRTRFLKFMIPVAAIPFIANSAGWIFTEMGRQPWVVFGMLKTADANSPTVTAGEVWTTLIGFTALYAILAVLAGIVFFRYVKQGPEPEGQEEGENMHLGMAY